jgi:hypothetical protein
MSGCKVSIWRESEIEQLTGALLCEFSIDFVAEMLDRDEDDVRAQVAGLGYFLASPETLH